MNRRSFIKTGGLSLGALLMSKNIFGTTCGRQGQLNMPDKILALTGYGEVELKRNGNSSWEFNNLQVELKCSDSAIDVWVTAFDVALCHVALVWDLPSKLTSTVMNDHWERTYGDVRWHRPNSTEIFPWYFMEISAKDEINGFGVKTGGASFCSWQILDSGLRCIMDMRSGGNGVVLGGRKVLVAQIVTHAAGGGANPHSELRKFLRKMCDKHVTPSLPVYGANDWYFSYGNNSDELILEHTAMIARLAEGLENRPFSVIDAGWFKNFDGMQADCCFGDMSAPNSRFKDMHRLAGEIRKMGVRPGIWTRPLCAGVKEPKNLCLPSIRGRDSEKQPILDPSIPENLERIKKLFRLYREWSYELVKFDFTTYDIFGKWGFEMIQDRKITENGWYMYDRSRTNAEIILNLYKNIREAAGDIYILGCNTISHLSAGIFEINRIGDDTSGIEWERTRKMGVNALAFRGAHHGIFYAADADCVGLTTKIDWDKNRQWMYLLANSGTPLFVSAQPEALGDEQKTFIKSCLARASGNLPVAEPVDWLENPVPVKWMLNGKVELFNWD